MIVLDTNVISELFRQQPNECVVAWLRSLRGEVAITAITAAELLAGVGRLPDGRRKAELSERIQSVLNLYQGGRSILPFDVAAAEHYAEILCAREAAGKPISMADAQIAAICRAHNATCATRNVRDFSDTGVRLINPWGAES